MIPKLGIIPTNISAITLGNNKSRQKCKLHAWLIIQLCLINLFPSLIARRQVGPQTKWSTPSKIVSDGRRLTISSSGRARRDHGSVFCVLASDHRCVLFHHSVLIIRVFTMMFRR